MATSSLMQGTPYIAFITPQAALEMPVSSSTVSDLISFYSALYGVSEPIMRTVIGCESAFNSNAIGDKGQSFGLVQIYKPWNKGITVPEAMNPFFAINFLAQNLSEGNGHLWTCYREHFGNNSA